MFCIFAKIPVESDTSSQKLANSAWFKPATPNKKMEYVSLSLEYSRENLKYVLWSGCKCTGKCASLVKCEDLLIFQTYSIISSLFLVWQRPKETVLAANTICNKTFFCKPIAIFHSCHYVWFSEFWSHFCGIMHGAAPKGPAEWRKNFKNVDFSLWGKQCNVPWKWDQNSENHT